MLVAIGTVSAAGQLVHHKHKRHKYRLSKVFNNNNILEQIDVCRFKEILYCILYRKITSNVKG